MEPLFVRHKPKQGRVCLMLGASLLLHSGVVGIGALWTQPEPELHSLPPIGPPDDIGYFSLPGLTPMGPLDAAQPSVDETPMPTSTPEVDVKVEPTPPAPTDTPDFAQPPEQTPQPRKLTAFRPLSTARATSVPTGAHSSLSGPSSSSAPGGSNNGLAKAAGTWVTPHPPYPHTSLAKPTGATTVQITTDATGRVSNIVILKSTGSPLLDNQTESYVRMNWHGPANANRTTEFVYQLR